MAIEFISRVGNSSNFLPTPQFRIRIPAGTQLGDLLVNFVSTNGGGSNAIAATGWTELMTSDWIRWDSGLPGVPSTGDLFVQVKFADATDVAVAGSSVNWSVLGTVQDTGGANDYSYIADETLCYRGVPTLPTTIVRGGFDSTPASTSHTIPGGLTSPNGLAYVIAAGCIHENRTDTISAPGFTQRSYQYGTYAFNPTLVWTQILTCWDRPTLVSGAIGPWPASSSVADKIDWIVLLASPETPAHTGLYVLPIFVPLGNEPSGI